MSSRIPLVCIVIAFLASVAMAQEKVNIRWNIPAGTNWTFEQHELMDLSTTVRSGGQQQQMKQHGTRKIAGKAEVLQSDDSGKPTSIRYTFDRDSGGMMDNGMGQQQPLPFALAGQTVTVTIGNGEFSHDFKGQLDEQTLTDLRSIATQEAFFVPKDAVGIGDSWNADSDALAKAWQLDPKQHKVSVAFSVKDLMDIKGKRAAVCEMAVDVSGELTPGLNGWRQFKGPVVIDVESGRILSADLNGECA